MAISLNKVFLMGNLTRDPELRYTPGGQAVSTLGLAVNNKFTKDGETKEDVLFVDITVWGRVAENCAEYLKKGSPVLVEGRLKYHTWESQEGQKRSKIDVTAMSVQFLPSSKGGAGKESSQDEFGDGAPPPSDDDVPF
ncbi:MAG: single-stranded DNA-binding protein [Nitrospinota bacterium]